LKRKAAIAIIVLMGAAILAADQYTKTLVRRTIPVNTSYMPIAWLDRFVTLTHVENHGASFGLLQGYGGLFAIVALGVVVGIGWYVWRYPALPRFMVFVFGLMLGGSLGNLVDRLFRGGVVTDFVDLRWWPVFNVADSCVVVGSILLGVYTLFFEGRREAAALPGDGDDAA
jgi:signal peptidase II